MNIGIAAASDVTKTFKDNGLFWPSYNVPFTESVYIATGFQAAYETYGDQYSYSNCTRAQIFARDASLLQSLDAVKHELRLNDYQNDPLQEGNPNNAVR